MTSEPFLSIRCRRAILDAEARALARVCARYGVLTRTQLAGLAGARRWTRAGFSDALAVAVDAGLIRDLGLGFYASLKPDTAPEETRARNPSETGGLSDEGVASAAADGRPLGHERKRDLR
jgi:hypothetical protein